MIWLVMCGAGKPGKAVIKSKSIRMPIVKYDPITEIKIKSHLIKEPQKINLMIGLQSYFKLIKIMQIKKKIFSMFIHCNVENVYILNGCNERFPSSPWNLDRKKLYKNIPYIY